jgi:hypothetical protein
MVNEKDFIYEYSDLNLFQTRVKVLTGKYKDIVVEFGTSGIMQGDFVPMFNFDYTLYQAPDNFKVTFEFEEYLADLLINVICHRNNDNLSESKLQQAAHVDGVQDSQIKIDKSFYPEQYGNYQPACVNNMKEF